MRVSLNWIKKYVDLPEDVSSSQIAYDLTLRTVEVESVEDTGDYVYMVLPIRIQE